MTRPRIHISPFAVRPIALLLGCLLCIADIPATAQHQIPITMLPQESIAGGTIPGVLILPDTGSALSPLQAWAAFENGQYWPYAAFVLPGKFEYEQCTFWVVFVLENRSDSLLDLLVRMEHFRDTIWQIQQGKLTLAAHFPHWFPTHLSKSLLPYDTKELSYLCLQPYARDTFFARIRHYSPINTFLPVLYTPESYDA